MKHITPFHMTGFTDELRKEAGVGDYLRRGVGAVRKNLEGKYSRQLLTGATAGAAGGAAMADPNEQGASVRGALKGALVGSGLAGGRILATRAGRQAAGETAKRFGKRQLYTMTGKGAKTMEEAQALGVIPKKLSSRDASRHSEAFREGWHTLPGVAKGLVTKPGKLVRNAWGRGGLVGKGFAGVGAYQAGKGVLERPEEGGAGRIEKGLRGAGSTLGWLVAPAGMVAGSVVGSGMGAIGGRAGRLADRGVRRVRGKEAAS